MNKNIIWKPIEYNSYYDGNKNSIYTIEQDDKAILFSSISDLSNYVVNGRDVDCIEIDQSLITPLLDMDSYKFSDIKMAAVLLNKNN